MLHRRSRSRDRTERKRDDSREKLNDEEKEKDRERRKRGLPPLVREKLSGTCSKTAAPNSFFSFPSKLQNFEIDNSRLL